ncbi:uncharacterized protein LOC115483145 isoform X1 [Drosophila hydei]|uniref:Uncharacterized protein LOC115483045 isoform X1 n=1 Tax=Drosophila hydei TaxID=7224 RepID=A0A6J2SPS8_DROHY|nr:uncharacterized protein LOC115483045 isoform X1 [Drosophila hydei]XP_030079723.1 uncharacterized protein LOC115483056 isoform X1 [Drosophila hydei]XP_030079727.1 uncharacterized protein LOC115483058 [Drosophila hydei]XP_030079728.1 uncharacterized protein LOC115483059 [Drosophila hydei]XP_030079729.1 uncharacterized protein LOC115483060 [Drosophila hydei]XP_030079733.1 uncharacterized protein LOC115483063 [Drosophila hydei]XP_030080166.1 uncharacterized protein LOC115483145 isoform X1 [Dro
MADIPWDLLALMEPVPFGTAWSRVYAASTTIHDNEAMQELNQSLCSQQLCRIECGTHSSTESERLFSKAGQIITERRALKAKHVDMLLFLHHNSWILAED